MKRIIYLIEIIICIAFIILAAFNWYMLYKYNYWAGAFIHVAAFLAYGVFAIVRIVALFSEYEALPKDFVNKIILLYLGCFMIIAAFVISYTSAAILSLICTVGALLIFAISVKNLRSRECIKLIIAFIALAAILYIAAFFLGLAESTPISIQELSQSEVRAYNIKMFLKSVGGAVSYCFIPKFHIRSKG